MAAAINAPPVRSSAPGKVAAVKKLAVSLMRCVLEPLRESAPVSAMGKPEYLFIKVAIRAPRMEYGASNDIKIRPTRAPRFTRRSEEHTSELQSRGHLVC